MKILFTKLSPEAKMPFQALESDAGYNLFSVDGAILKPGERRLFKTNISAAIPQGFYGRIAPRSGMAYKHGIDVLAGVVDSGYRGDIGVILINLSDVEYEVLPGDKIAQYIITPCMTQIEREEVESVEELGASRRSEGGWGSTGR